MISSYIPRNGVNGKDAEMARQFQKGWNRAGFNDTLAGHFHSCGGFTSYTPLFLDPNYELYHS